MQISGEAMKRDILFKAKCLGNGEWIEGWYYQKPNPLTRNGEPIRHFISNCPPFASEIDPETVCQYTGLKDKEGRRIFEGDIISAHLDEKNPDDETINFVKWSGFGWCSVQPGFDPDPISDFDIGLWMVVGNIHDNPELIERK